MTELEKLNMLCELFGWDPADDVAKFHALVILRRARMEDPPTYDEFKVLAGDRVT